MDTKVCSKCGEEKPTSEYYTSKSKCKKCISLSVNHENKIKNDKKYRDSHREKLRENARIKNSQCPEEKHNRYIRYYSKHKEYVKGKSKNWYQLNKEKSNEYSKQYHAKNKDKTSVSKRNLVLLKSYGITEKDYDDIYNLQNGVCAICGKPETCLHNKTNKLRKLAIDHDHETGKIRGLLCGNCNMALGKFNDSIDMLKIAIKYLESYK